MAVSTESKLLLVRDFLKFIVGRKEIDREGLVDTPNRVVAAWEEFTSGYDVDPNKIAKSFEDGAENYDQLILVSNLPVWSKCEHHLETFFGLAHVGYIPNGRILGISKFARIVDAYARRLQVQERMTGQIADCIAEALRPKAVGVVVQCRHFCMESRGIKSRGAVTTTSAVRGMFRESQSAREEFMSLVEMGRNGVVI